MKLEDIEITIRQVQNYLYCPHQWGLINICKIWQENFFVTRANLLHNRVHDPNNNYFSRGKRVFSSVNVYNDTEYNLYGVVDTIELTEDKNGIKIEGYDERYKLTIVEYKPTKPKNEEYRYEDLMQVFAQKVCVDYVFNCDSEGVIYYANNKKRVKLPFRENYDLYKHSLKEILKTIREYIKNGVVPEIKNGQNCFGCSIKDVCIPKIKKNKGIKRRIEEVLKDEKTS